MLVITALNLMLHKRFEAGFSLQEFCWQTEAGFVKYIVTCTLLSNLFKVPIHVDAQNLNFSHKKTGDLALMKIEPMELHENARCWFCQLIFMALFKKARPFYNLNWFMRLQNGLTYSCYWNKNLWNGNRTTHPMSNMDLNPHDFDPTGLFCNVSGWGHLQAGSPGAPRDLQVSILSTKLLR